jgi:hypothetical protein
VSIATLHLSLSRLVPTTVAGFVTIGVERQSHDINGSVIAEPAALR